MHQWCQSHHLQLNSSKSKIIWLGTRLTLQKIATSNLTLEIGDKVVQPASVVRDLGVLADQELTLKQRVAKIASSCFYQLRLLKQVRRYVDNDVMAGMTQRPAPCSFHDQPSRLLQPSPCWHSSIDDCANTAGPEHRCIICSRSQTIRPHNPSTSSTALAAGRLSCAVQTVYINACNR